MNNQDEPRELPTNEAVFLGGGLFAGTMKDGRRFFYQGVLVRVPNDTVANPRNDPDADRHAWELAIKTIPDQLVALMARGDWELIDVAPLEFTGCRDAETGDWLVLWRIACLERRTH